jgi:hypothetical protein
MQIVRVKTEYEPGLQKEGVLFPFDAFHSRRTLPNIVIIPYISL